MHGIELYFMSLSGFINAIIYLTITWKIENNRISFYMFLNGFDQEDADEDDNSLLGSMKTMKTI